MEYVDKLLKVGWNIDRMQEVYVMEHTDKLLKVFGNIDKMQECLCYGTHRQT